MMSTTNSFNSLLDNKSLNKFMEYNLDTPTATNASSMQYGLTTAPRENVLNTTSNTLRLLNLTDKNSTSTNYSLEKLVNYPTTTSLLSSETDGKQLNNSFKYLLNNRWAKKTFINNNINDSDSVQTFSSKFFNEDLSYRFKDLKSSNQQLLTSDRNTRLINNLTPSKTILNFNDKGSNLNSLIHNNISESLGTNSANLFNSSNLG